MCMTRAGRFLVVSILVLLGGVPALAQTKQAPEAASKTKRRVHRLRAGTPNKEGLYEARSTEGPFQVTMPLPFNDYTIEGKTDAGQEFSTHAISSRTVEGVDFLVLESSRISGKSQSADAVLKDFIAGFKNGDNTLSGEKFFKYAGYPTA